MSTQAVLSYVAAEHRKHLLTGAIMMPNEWRPHLELRAGGQMLSREKARHPNTRLKNVKLKLVGGTEASAPH